MLVHLRPFPVVARVTSGAAGVDPGDVERELAVARHAVRVGAPVVQPRDLLPPGPHRRDGHTLVFWRYLERAGELDRAAAGRGSVVDELSRLGSVTRPRSSRDAAPDSIALRRPRESAGDAMHSTVQLRRHELCDAAAACAVRRQRARPLAGATGARAALAAGPRCSARRARSRLTPRRRVDDRWPVRLDADDLHRASLRLCAGSSGARAQLERAVDRLVRTPGATTLRP